jgi:hypothetical protein
MPFYAILILLLASGAASGAGEIGISGNPAGVSSADQESSTPKRAKHSSKHSKQEGQTETLTGTVEWEYKPLSWDCDVPNCDHFALYDDARRANYELDDSRAAVPFEGKRARVTGVVNIKDSVIHVLSIEAAK